MTWADVSCSTRTNWWSLIWGQFDLCGLPSNWQMRASRFTVLSWDVITLGKSPSLLFSPKFVLSFISNFQDSFRGSGKQLHLFCNFFIIEMKTPLNAGKHCFGDARSLEEIVGIKKNQTSLWGDVFQSFFLFSLSLIFVGFLLNYSSLPWNINSMDILC